VEVVLRADVEKLGLRGEVVNVARGYARNYLLPRGLAEPATPGLVRELEKRDAVRARSEAKSVDEARAIAQRLEATELRFDVSAGPTGSLFGSVTPTNVADKLWEEQKVRVDRRKLDMEAIKRVGRYTVPLELFTDVTVELHLVVAPEGVEPPLENEPEPEPESTPESDVAPLEEGPEELEDSVEAAELEGDEPADVPAE
jgi:large subunit ribosomal protein L9